MKRLVKWVLASVVSVLACNAEAVGFIDYKPSSFSEQAIQPFFYSIGKELKHGDSIREDAPTLLKAGPFDGRFDWIYPSPDQMKAVALVGDRLYLVKPGQATRELLHNVNKAPQGEPKYFSSVIQWDSGSRYIFIPKIEPNQVQNTQRKRPYYPSALMRIDTEGQPTEQELIPSDQFIFSTEFFVLSENSVCFDSPTYEGDVVWKCWVEGRLHQLKDIEDDQITFEDGGVVKGKPFFSYKNPAGGEIFLVSSGFSLTAVPNTYIVEFFHSSRPSQPIFRVEGATEPLKGHFIDGVSQNGSSVLPGGRYAFLDMFPFKRALLVDGKTGLYKEVPSDTRVWLDFNSYVNPTSFHIVGKHKQYFRIELKGDNPLRTNYRR